MWACEQAMWVCLCAGSFFPFSCRRLCYFVLSALDFGEFKHFNGRIYQNLRELSLFVLYVHEYDFELPWLWDINCGNSYISLAEFWLYLLICSSHDRQLRLYLVENCVESVDKIHKSEPEPRNGSVNTIYFIHQGKYSNQSHIVCLR